MLRSPRGRLLTSVAAVKGGEVRCVTTQRFALLRSQLILFEPLQQNAALDSLPNHVDDETSARSNRVGDCAAPQKWWFSKVRPSMEARYGDRPYASRQFARVRLEG